MTRLCFAVCLAAAAVAVFLVADRPPIPRLFRSPSRKTSGRRPFAAAAVPWSWFGRSSSPGNTKRKGNCIGCRPTAAMRVSAAKISRFKPSKERSRERSPETSCTSSLECMRKASLSRIPDAMANPSS